MKSVDQNGSGIVGGDILRGRVFLRHHAPRLDERLQRGLRRLRQLDEERHDVQRNETVGHQRRGTALNSFVADRKHELSLLPTPSKRGAGVAFPAKANGGGGGRGQSLALPLNWSASSAKSTLKLVSEP